MIIKLQMHQLDMCSVLLQNGFYMSIISQNIMDVVNKTSCHPLN